MHRWGRGFTSVVRGIAAVASVLRETVWIITRGEETLNPKLQALNGGADHVESPVQKGESDA